ncbi:MAG: hypothetical protein RBQ97_02545 [Acholeplasma sp.]|nr:hypothetical protein [Acholeplasma sp.]
MESKKKIKISHNNGYYLPMYNDKGIVSAITPFFSGDLKRGYYNYAIKPASELDLFNLTDRRNVIFDINNKRYDLNGQMPWQQDDEVEIVYEQLSQQVIRKNNLVTLDTLSFVPVSDNLEVHLIKITNNSNEKIRVKTTVSIPLYSRSPENIFDHRHVTSLLNRVKVLENGIFNKPSLSFDERGHKINEVIYSVFANIEGVKPVYYYPNLDDYIDGGSFLYPKGIYKNRYKINDEIDGYEANGGIGFDEFVLEVNEEKHLTVTVGIHDDEKKMIAQSTKYFEKDVVKKEHQMVLDRFNTINKYIKFTFGNEEYCKQLSWITLQPILRRHLGNSFLPHHDYGHGGRGWRDLWQDLLSLIFSHDESVFKSIINNFAGVRIDGSNATIIGNKSGEFKADRNQIIRVWSDHGSWPLLTVKMYIDETNDIDLLRVNQTYFDDQFTHYTKKTKSQYGEGNKLTFQDGQLFYGTILEHIILQNIVGILNVGKHGFVRLEDADWNDGLDMGNKNGETIPFTFFYTNNLRIINELLEKLNDVEIELFNHLELLIFGNITLNDYFDYLLNKPIKKTWINKNELIKRLNHIVDEKLKHINKNAWISDTHYQSYYNNDGVPVDNKNTASLTAQTMGLINNIPSQKEVERIAKFTREILFDRSIGGYRLNSDYNKVMMNLGRAYGFAYGHKENGAVFAHMATMYTFGLYQYNLVNYGNESLRSLIDQTLSSDSNVLAGVPEYFNNRGQGKYLYLTGTGSWMVHLFRTQVFGIKMNFGVLTLEPKLAKCDFIAKKASIQTYLFGHMRKITYINSNDLEYGEYKIYEIRINGKTIEEREFTNLNGDMEVILGEKS